MPRSRPPLSRDEILHAALQMLDQQGLEGLSMRKLATQLGVEAMSLYNHVKSKDDLLNGLANLVLSRIPLPSQALSGPEVLAYFAESLYQAFLEHPALVMVLGRLEPEGMNVFSLQVLQGMERVLVALGESGLEPSEQVSAFRGLIAMCLGFVTAHTLGLTGTKQEALARWEDWNHQQFEAPSPYLLQLAPYFLQTRADDDFRFMLNIYLEALQSRSKP